MVSQFNSIIQLIQAFPDNAACIAYLEDIFWNGNPVSPFDPSSQVYKCADGRYKCRNTNKYFNVIKGTIFENTNIPLQKWFVAMWFVTCNTNGKSSVELSKDIGVSQKTAWVMLHKIRKCLKKDDPDLGDDVQLDETFVGGKNKNRHADKKVANSQGRSFKDKTPVLGMLSEGKVKAFVIESTSAQSVQPLIFEHITPMSTIISDEWVAYTGLDKYYDHQVVDHRAKQYVNDCGFTTNALEGFWTQVKNAIRSTYHKVSKFYLSNYVAERVFRFNNRSMTNYERFNNAISRI